MDNSLSSPFAGSVPSTVTVVTTEAAESTTMPSHLFKTTREILKSPSSFGALIMGIFSIVVTSLNSVSSVLLWLAHTITITIPARLFTLFSVSLTITMNATTLLLMFALLVSTITWFLRYRYLNVYSRLPPEPQRKQPNVELFPEAQDGDSKRGIHNYLDEFLSAIKIFGYLERPVFHELTRTMQTKKLIAGETFRLEDEQGFCLVVDGLVQIFVKSTQNQSNASNDDDDDDDDAEGRNNRNGQGYQLLTEVKNGAPLTSLFSILSLFTEDVKLRYDDDEAVSRPPSAGMLRPLHSGQITPGLGPITPLSEREGFLSTPASPNFDRGRVPPPPVEGSFSSVPPLSLDSEHLDSSHKYTEHRKNSTQPQMVPDHPEIVARATVDTTIAVIPVTAFKRLTRVYPKAASHIVQVILTRFQRVTLTTGHAYFGLTDEVLRTERLMNRYTTFDLPGSLKGSALERLKTKFNQEKDRIGEEEGSKGIALHNPGAQRRRRQSSSLRKDAAVHATFASRVAKNNQRNFSAEQTGKPNVNAGDLLSNINDARRGHRRGTRNDRSSMSQPFQTSNDGEDAVSNYNPASPREIFASHRQESQDEDTFFRESIADCMLKAIGLTNSRGTIKRVESVEQSPRLVSYDARRQKAIFNNNNAFGFIDAFESSADGETESVTSIPTSMTSIGGSGTINDELARDVEIVYFPKGSVLVEQGERNPGLYYVIDGFLDVTVTDDAERNLQQPRTTASVPVNDPHWQTAPLTVNLEDDLSDSPLLGKKERSTRRNTGKSLFLTKPGGLAGYLGTVSSRRSFVNIVAKTDVYVGFLPRASIERIVDKHPIVLLTMAKRLTSLLPRLILHLDFALEWMQVDAGQAVYRQEDESDAIYIVLNGRLRSIQERDDGTMHVIAEYGQGDSVGELEVLTESQRPGSLHAIRDTELAKLPKTLFNSLSLENPGVTLKISRIIASRMRDLTEKSSLKTTSHTRTKSRTVPSSSTSNLRTVAVLPVTSGVPIIEFASRLLSALTQIGTTSGVISLNQATILNHLGRHAFSRMGKLKLSQYLADLEEKYGLVLYVADTTANSPWTQTCINQADCILLVGLGEGSPSVGEYERLLLTTKTTARKELVLLHTERSVPPGSTRKWLRNRMWINGSHHHVHMPFRHHEEPTHSESRRFGNSFKQSVQILQAEIQKYTSKRVRQTPLYSADAPFKSDFHRLARRITGKSVGLVLGGGGARGISHIGIIRALEEAGVPIDMVGGTSIGSFVGGLYAWDADMVPMYGRAKKFAGRMASIWRFALDLTYPAVSYTTGHEFNRGIFKAFGTAQFEDLWLEFYCNTTNVSKSRLEIHTSGYVWRYVRASMTLAGLIPPLCDEGNMLMDGGYMDNLTVRQMKETGADIIFAIDVGAVDDDTPQHYDDSLSGFWAVFNRWNIFSSHANPPSLSDIQARLAYVSSIDALERAKSTPGCIYMRPPVAEYGTLDFGRFDEIYKVGYKYGKEFLEELRQQGVLPMLEESDKERQMRRTMAPRRASI